MRWRYGMVIAAMEGTDPQRFMLVNRVSAERWAVIRINSRVGYLWVISTGPRGQWRVVEE